MPGVFEAIAELPPAATQRQVQNALSSELNKLIVTTSNSTAFAVAALCVIWKQSFRETSWLMRKVEPKLATTLFGQLSKRGGLVQALHQNHHGPIQQCVNKIELMHL